MKNLQGVALILALSVSGVAATGGCRTTQSAGKQVDDVGIKIQVEKK